MPKFLLALVAWYNRLSIATQKFVAHVVEIGGGSIAGLTAIAAVLPSLHVPAQALAYVTAAIALFAAVLKFLGGFVKAKVAAHLAAVRGH